jgi:hypothetical protein
MYKAYHVSVARTPPPRGSPPSSANSHPQPLGVYLNNTTHFSRVAGHTGLLDPEDGDTLIPRKFGNYSPNDRASHPPKTSILYSGSFTDTRISWNEFQGTRFDLIWWLSRCINIWSRCLCTYSRFFCPSPFCQFMFSKSHFYAEHNVPRPDVAVMRNKALQLLFNITNPVVYVQPGLTLKNSTFCPHSVFKCFVRISKQTAIISLYSTNWLIFITETVCLLRGTDWYFNKTVYVSSLKS